jgi:uncharacterized protein (DUF934 family)
MKNNSYLRKIFLIIDDWKNDFENYSKIELLRDAFMYAKTEHEIDTIVMANLKFIDRVGLWKLANNAKKRLRNLQITKMKLTEKFYLN